jgi:glutamyl-Q tRNA(Asp) synthetase
VPSREPGPGDGAYRGRFAPSPTGDLHFGSLFAALGSWLRARAAAVEWLIRVEDLDPPREVPGSAERIIATLAAYGMESDRPIVRQSQRSDYYDKALACLREQGHAFACACSRKTLSASGMHHGACARVPANKRRRVAWRVLAPDLEVGFDDLLRGRFGQNLSRAVGDFVVRRVEGYYAYQLAVVVDDADQGITEIVRGGDLLDSTPRQIHLQRLLGLPTPRYLHLPLVVDRGGHKLSKQLASAPVSSDDPLPALLLAAELLGIPTATLSDSGSVAGLLRRAQQEFRLDRIPTTPTVAL